MVDSLIQFFLVILLGGIATYDTLQSRRRKNEEKQEETGDLFHFQN
jgi:hypothetical protein